jgi:hypothetical protein
VKTNLLFVVVSLGLGLAACSSTPPADPEATIESVELKLATKNYVYTPGNRVLLVAVVKDSNDEIAPDEFVIITPDTAGRATLVFDDGQQATFTLVGSGPLGFTACLADYPDICDSITLGVDDGRPVLAIESPAPGAEIDNPDGIVVSGSAVDTSGTLEVFVNGTLLELDEQGHFTTTLPPGFGVRHLDITATDALTEATHVEMDVLYAARFTPAKDDAGKPKLSMNDAVGIWLGQDFFDNGQPFDATPPLVTRDIADMLELVVTNADLTGLLPNITLPGGSLNISSVTLGSPQAVVSVRDDGVDLYVRVGSLNMTTGGQIDLDGAGGEPPFNLTGTLNGSAIAYVRLGVSKASPTAEAVVTLTSFEVGIESLQGTFNNPEVNAIFALASGPLRVAVEQQVANALDGVLDPTVPDLLETVLSSLDHALAGLTLPLDQPPLPPLTLTLDGRMARIDATYRSNLLAPLNLAISTGVDNAHPDSRGVARLDDGTVEPNFFAEGSVQVGVRFGFLNGALHVLWASGLLDLDVSAFLPPFAQAIVSDAKLNPRLPPVLRPPREGEPYDLVLSIGQLELELTSEGKPIRFGAIVEVGVDLTVNANKVTMSVAETPNLHVWQLTSSDSAGLLTPELISELVSFLWPDLREAVGSLISLELPIPSIDALGEIAPELAGFTLTLNQTGPRLYPRGELLLLDATFTGSIPE